MSISRRTCLAMGVALGLSACLGGNSPEASLTDFYKALEAENTDAVLALVATGDTPASQMQAIHAKVKLVVAQASSQIRANGGIDDIRILDSRVSDNGEYARVNAEIIYNNGKSVRESHELLKENGQWKVKL